MAAAPIVFQCGTCQSVVSDSNQLLSAIAELDVLVLDAVVGVTLKAGEPEAGYSMICCSACAQELGRLYTDAPSPSLTAVVHQDQAPRYALSRGALKSYMLGSAQQMHEQRRPVLEESTRAQSGTHTASSVAPSELDLTARILALESSEAEARQQLMQLMRVVLALDQRLQSMEAGDSGNAEGEQGERKRPR